MTASRRAAARARPAAARRSGARSPLPAVEAREPGVLGMHELQGAAKPAPPFGSEPWQSRLEVLLVLRLVGVLRLVQQDHLRTTVREPSASPLDQALIRHRDRRAAAADPRVAVVGRTEDVQPPRSFHRLADPRLMRL